MPALVAGIHVFLEISPSKTWMAGLALADTSTKVRRVGQSGKRAPKRALQQRWWARRERGFAHPTNIFVGRHGAARLGPAWPLWADLPVVATCRRGRCLHFAANQPLSPP